MLNGEIKEMINYLKNIVSEEKTGKSIPEKYADNPDFIELDAMIKGIRNSSKEHFEMIFDIFPDPTIITTMNEGKLIAYNKAFIDLSQARWSKIINEDTSMHDLYFELDQRERLIEELNKTGISENMEIIVNDVKDEIFMGLVSSRVINIEGIPHILSVIRDITEMKKMEEQIKQLSMTDKLTQLFNRPKMDEFLQMELERSERTNTLFSIILMDIDFFKTINDTYGNLFGDAVLVELANILKKNVRSTDIVGRWSGEELLIVLPDTDNIGATILAEKIRALIEENIFEKVGRITASFGISVYKKDLLTASVISRADTALGKAKEKGRNRLEFL